MYCLVVLFSFYSGYFRRICRGSVFPFRSGRISLSCSTVLFIFYFLFFFAWVGFCFWRSVSRGDVFWAVLPFSRIFLFLHFSQALPLWVLKRLVGGGGGGHFPNFPISHLVGEFHFEEGERIPSALRT